MTPPPVQALRGGHQWEAVSVVTLQDTLNIDPEADHLLRDVRSTLKMERGSVGQAAPGQLALGQAAPSLAPNQVAPEEAADAPSSTVWSGHRFRPAALKAREEDKPEDVVLRVAPPLRVAVTLLLSSLVFACVALAFVCDVDVTARGRGVLRVQGGVHVVSAQVPGIVTEVTARSGDDVRAGDVIALLDSASVRAKLIEATERLAVSRATLAQVEGRRKALYGERLARLREQSTLLSKRAASGATSVAAAERRASRFDSLSKEGLASALDVGQAAEDRAQAVRAELLTRQELATVRSQAAGVEVELDTDQWKARAAVREAAAERESAVLAIEQLKIVAPRNGRMEAVLVRAGDTLAAGAAVGKLVPADAQLEVVSFIPERDRAFLEPGKGARMELEQLPASEFGALSGTVRRIATDLAVAAEIRDALGEGAATEGAFVRVELTLNDDEQTKKLVKYLRSGSMLSIRYPLRKRRAIAVLFEPLQHLFR